MATPVYPGGVKQWTDKVDFVDDVSANHINEAYAEIIAIETDLIDKKYIKPARFIIGTSATGWIEKDCDYLCDGTDDQVEINAAIQALPVTGGEIVILDGTYNITAKIDVNKDNVSVKGNGSTTILKRMWNCGIYYEGGDYWDGEKEGVIHLSGVRGCKVEGLCIDGNKSVYVSYYNDGVFLDSASNNIVTGTTCKDSGEAGIDLARSNSNSIVDNICTGNAGRGIRLSHSSHNVITGNVNDNNEGYGVQLYYSDSNVVAGNVSNNNGDAGIRLDASNNNTVTGNTNNDNKTGILLSFAKRNIITGNMCIRGTGQPSDYIVGQYTIYLMDEYCHYNLISSNNCMGKAVVSGGGTGNTIFNNKWNESDDFSAHLEDYATLSDLGHVKHGVYTTTLNTTWAGSSPPYSKEQTIAGILADDTPVIDVVMSGIFETDEARAEAWGYIYRAVTAANKVTFYATEKPAVDLPIQLKVVR